MIDHIKNRLADHIDLTEEEMRYFLQAAIAGELTEAKKIEVLSLMNSKGVTGNELAFAVMALQTDIAPTDAIDVCGTGGSGLARINTSTLSAFVLAAAGVKIAKHGNRAASGRCGSFDLLEKLGVTIDLTCEQSTAVFEQLGIAFFFAPKCFPQMGAFGLARKAMGTPTMFNLLGPLLSPLNPRRQLIGTSTDRNARLILEACRQIGREEVFVVVGHGGLDEVSLAGESSIYSLAGEPFVVTPQDFGYEAVDYAAIAGGGTEENAAIALRILSGEEIASPHSRLVTANAALAFKLVDPEISLAAAAKEAEEIIRSGKALAKLEEVKAATQQFA